MATFDVFLSHNTKDLSHVRELKRLLMARGISAWLAEDELRPGLSWQRGIEAALRVTASVAVLVGTDGIGPWEDEESRAALILATKYDRPVVPVLLPGAFEPRLPLLLCDRAWVDFRSGFSNDELARLEWGITGRQPQALTSPPTDKGPRTTRREPFLFTLPRWILVWLVLGSVVGLVSYVAYQRSHLPSKPSSLVGHSSSQVAARGDDGGGSSDPASYASFVKPWGCTLAPPVKYVTSDSAHHVKAADLNGDRKVDVAVLTQQTLDMWLNLGDRGLGQQHKYLIDENPETFAIADINTDGVSDFVIGYWGRVDVIMNHGSAVAVDVLPSSDRYATVADAGTTDLGVGDLDGDGRPDLVVGSGEAILVYLNRGNGTFGPPTRHATCRHPSLVIADLNGDRLPDIAVGDYYGRAVQIFINLGGGSFSSPSQYTVSDGSHHHDGASFAGSDPIAVGDFDGDGHPDIAVANARDRTAGLLLNAGNGQFKEYMAYIVPPASVPFDTPSSIVVGDLNGDGATDLAVTNYAGGSDLSRPQTPAESIGVLLNGGGGKLVSYATYAAGPAPKSVVAADLDNDGHDDLVVLNTGALGVEHSLNVLLARCERRASEGSSAPGSRVPGTQRR